MTDNELKLALLAAKYMQLYNDSNPDVGMGPSREYFIDKIEKLSGVTLDKKMIIRKWGDV